MQHSDPWNAIEWLSPELFRVKAIEFDLVSWDSPKKQSTRDRFVLVKDPPFAGSMSRILRGCEVTKVLEFGLYHGGSLVLFDVLYQLQLAIGIDDRPSAPALSDYIERERAFGRFHPYHSTDQADRSQVIAILERHFPDKDIDLIVDDASHLYEKALASFEASFPYLRPGGIYIIEDWGWAHWSGRFQTENIFEGQPLSRLLFELIMVQASSPDLIARIEIDFHHVGIVRGAGPLNEVSFRLRNHYFTKRDIHFSHAIDE